MKGGIASYLLGVYKKYFSYADFEVIVPKNIGAKEVFLDLPFKVNQVAFRPFDINNSIRDQCNLKIIEILRNIKPDVILFGYLRSHSETGELYKKINPKVFLGIFVHAKEAFINECIVRRNNKGGSHKGYTKEEALFYKEILNSVDIIISVSNFTKRLLIKQGIKSKIIVVNPPIREMHRIDSVIAKRRLGLERNIPILLSVGRLIKRKGQDKVIRLIPKLKEHYPLIKYLIVGNGPEINNIKNLIKELKIEQNVTLFVSVENEELGIFYSACDLFILPCDFIEPNDIEGFGIVFLEASSFGKPCIGGNTGGVPESVLNNKTGFLIDPKSQEEIKEKILLLLKNKNLKKKFSLAALKTTSVVLSNSKSNKLIDIFKRNISHS